MKFMDKFKTEPKPSAPVVDQPPTPLPLVPAPPVVTVPDTVGEVAQIKAAFDAFMAKEDERVSALEQAVTELRNEITAKLASVSAVPDDPSSPIIDGEPAGPPNDPSSPPL